MLSVAWTVFTDGSIHWAEQLDLAGRLLTAAVLGGLIGLEREIRGRSAGLRTQMLVAMGAAMAMIVSLQFAKVFGDAQGSIRVDPARVAYGVMGGVGFLGAGAIMRFGVGVRGLTTAASLWCTAAVGLAAGFGMYVLATLTAVLVLLILWGLRSLDHALPHAHDREVAITTAGSAADATERLRRLLTDAGLKAAVIAIWSNADHDTARVTFRVVLRRPEDLAILVRVTERAEGVSTLTVE